MALVPALLGVKGPDRTCRKGAGDSLPWKIPEHIPGSNLDQTSAMKVVMTPPGPRVTPAWG